MSEEKRSKITIEIDLKDGLGYQRENEIVKSLDLLLKEFKDIWDFSIALD